MAVGATSTELIINDKGILHQMPGRIISANGKYHHFKAPGPNTDDRVVGTEAI